MAWHPNDLVSAADLQAYERTILTQFGATDDWHAKRQKALEDWLFPLLASMGMEPSRLRTRASADQVWGLTSSAYTDYTARATNQTIDDLPLATILAGANDAVLIGSTTQFRGVSLRMHEAVSSVTATLAVEAWRDQWKPFSAGLVDGTQATDGKPFSKGGSITWTIPDDWVTRSVNTSAALYYARLRLSSAPTGASLGQVSVIRRSCLCAAVTLRTLAYIFHEAPIAQDGPWKEKADWYEAQSRDAWERVLPVLGREFDTDVVDDVIGTTEATQTTDAAGGGWAWSRA